LPAFDSTQLDIGQEPQYFFDDLVIETVENVRRTFHCPEKVEDEPVLRKDMPWEHVLELSCGGYQVIWDPRDSVFKMWYLDDEMMDLKPGDMVTCECFRMLYAYSEDGVHWTKPALGMETINGHDTNVVLGGNGYCAYNLAVLLDPLEKDESRRLKALCTHFKKHGDCDTTAYVTSGDGIHWKREAAPQFGRFGSRLDDGTSLSYNEKSRIYTANVRHYDMYAVQRNYKTPCLYNFTPPYYPQDWARQNKRRTWQCDSADMVHWSEPYLVLCPEDGLDDLDATFYYGLCRTRMGDGWLGLLNIMNYVHNDMHTRLVFSRDGHTWKHLNCRRPWIKPRGPGFWDAYINTIGSPPIRVGNELCVFYGGARNHHDWWFTGGYEGLEVPEARDINEVSYGIGLAKLRADGYCSLEAGPARDGIFVTRPLISTGERLVINASCSPGGSIAVDVVDHNDDVIPGLSKEECDVFAGDSIAHTVTWRGRNHIPVGSTDRAVSLQPERERIRKLRFYLRKAHLYSFTLASGHQVGAK
jgi:hypothetical protein